MDFVKFSERLFLLADIFRIVLKIEVVDIYWRHLQSYPDKFLNEAFDELEQGKKFPLIADFQDIIREKNISQEIQFSPQEISNFVEQLNRRRKNGDGDRQIATPGY